MNQKQAIRMSYIVNTVLLAFVLALMGLFALVKAPFLVLFSVPTTAVYLINYFLIGKGKLRAFVSLVYFWLTLYMGVATVCLGYTSGFHLYTFSMIPIVFYTEYMAYQLQMKKTKALTVSVEVLFVYLASAVYSIMNGPVYALKPEMRTSFTVINAITVISFITFYSRIMIKMIVDSDEKLKKMALRDKLTGLYNRHYMIEQIEKKLNESDGKLWIAMVDLDDFKSINDRFGHNAGDFVLVKLGEIMRQICENCTIARWGGEEYIIMAEEENVSVSALEKLREKVCEAPFCYQETKILVSVTIGAAFYEPGMNMDSWIQKADALMYEGKQSGKNRVIL